jgi:phosphate uptake regulator
LDLRRLQKTSDGTFFVTLPKGWVVRNKLEKGAILSFSERKDGKILAEPYGEQERKIATVTLTPGPLLQREIEEKYLLGYDVFEIVSQQTVPPDTREIVRRIVRSLVGLEIVEENAKKIVVQCLIEPSLLFPDRILRRLHLITLAMQKDAVSSFVRGDAKLAHTIVERDEDVDRLYFLLVRVVRAALTDPAIAEKLGASPIDCLDYRIVASFVENFADYASDIAESTWPRTKGKDMEGAMRSVEKAGDVLNRMHKDAVDAVFTRNLALAQEVTNLSSDANASIRSAERGLVNAKPETIDRLATVISALRAMSGINVDIADLAVTR